jgi:hypothetical protein
VLVLEATALFEVLRAGYEQNPQAITEDWAAWPKKENLSSIDGKANATGIYIADMVFYEATGFRPDYIPTLLETLRAAKENGNVSLARTIDALAHFSPRGGKNNGDPKKQHVRALLYWITKHPESIVTTKVGKWFSQVLEDENILLYAKERGSSYGSLPANYRLSRHDVALILPDDFKEDALRIHISDFYAWGLLREDKVRKLAAHTDQKKPQSKGLATDKNFITLKDLGIADSDETYLTYGYFKEHPDLLRSISPEPKAASWKSKLAQPVIVTDIEETRTSAKMMMEQFIFGGLLPEQEIPAIAVSLGFLSEEEAHQPSKKKMRQQLKDRGFFAYAPTISDLQQLWHRCEDNPAYYLLGKLLSHAAADRIINDHAERLNSQCRRPLRLQPTKAQPIVQIPESGLPLERYFSVALVDGLTSIEEFLELLKQTGALEHGFISNGQQDISVEQTDGKPAMIWFRRQGVHSRTAPDTSTRFEIMAERHSPHSGQEQSGCTLEKLASLCLKSSTQDVIGDKAKPIRLIDAMLFPAIERNASNVLATAESIIGKVRLQQILSAGHNAHRQRWKEVVGGAYFRSCLVEQESFGRMHGFHNGEVATLEAAIELRKKREGTVIIANHDNALRGSKDDPVAIAFGGEMMEKVQLTEGVEREKTELRQHCLDLRSACADMRLYMATSHQCNRSLAKSCGRAGFTPSVRPVRAEDRLDGLHAF